jgi:hypothetical protein
LFTAERIKTTILRTKTLRQNKRNHELQQNNKERRFLQYHKPRLDPWFVSIFFYPFFHLYCRRQKDKKLTKTKIVLWDIFFGLPIAYALAYLNKRIFQYLGHEEFMQCPGGVRLNQAIFALINIWLVLGWGWQLTQEAKSQREENVRRIKREINYWDEEIERLRGLLDVSHPIPGA